MSFRIPVVLDGDGSGFTKMIEEATHHTEHFAEKTTGLLKSVFSGSAGTGLFAGGLATLGLGEVGHLIGELAGEFNQKVKDVRLGVLETGLDPEVFQQFRNLAEASGIGVDSFTGALQKMSVALAKIAGGGEDGKKVIEQLHTIGLTVKDMDMSNAGKSFTTLFDQLHRLGTLDIPQRSALQGLMGKGAARLEAAAQMGRESMAANVGMLEPDVLDAASQRGRAARYQTAITRHMEEEAGGFASRLWFGLKMSGMAALGLGGDMLDVMGKDQAKIKAEKHETPEILKEQQEKVLAEQEEMRKRNRAAAEQEVFDKKRKEEEKTLTKAGEIEEKNRLAKLKPRDRLKELQRLSGELEKGELTADKRLRLAELQGEMIPLQNSIAKSGAHFNVDALARIGGFAGTGGAAGPGKQLDRIAKACEATAMHTANTRPKGRVP